MHFTKKAPINVSLTYLRGLEIAELKEEDMPMTKGLTIFLYVVLLSLFIQFNFY
jgi:hypothetical protein